MLAISPPNPNVLHPFFICSMTSFTAGRQPLGSLDKRTDRQPSTSQQILPARGRLHPSGSALDVICNSAFKGFVAEAHCLLSRSSKIIVELNSQEQLERKQEKNPNPKCKRTSQSQQISGLFKASESICLSLWLHCFISLGSYNARHRINLGVCLELVCLPVIFQSQV